METDGNIGKQLETGEGNTITSPDRKRIVPSKCWAFTYFYKSENDIMHLETILSSDKSWKWIYGRETCLQGRPHLQGYVNFKNKVRPVEKIKIKEIHWEKTKGTEQQNIDYCSKDGIVTTNVPQWKKYILIDPMKGKTLYGWQNTVVNLIRTTPDDRSVHWVWEINGCKGKTSIAKHICMNYNALFVSGKVADVKFAIADMMKKNKYIDIVIFHYVRSNEQFVSYEAIEALKDGIFFSSKYESGMVMYNPPHILVFANFSPELKKLSADRWKILNIGLDNDNEFHPALPSGQLAGWSVGDPPLAGTPAYSQEQDNKSDVSPSDYDDAFLNDSWIESMRRYNRDVHSIESSED